MHDESAIDLDFDPVQLTPKQFEQEIRRFFSASGSGLTDLQVVHDEVIPASDGSYQIDVTARFQAFGVNILVLIECKHQKNAVKRAIVQELEGKLQSIGAHKGIICSTGGFQEGALLFARQHGIALVHIVDGRAVYAVKSLGGQLELPPWGRPYVARLVSGETTDTSFVIRFDSDVDMKDLGEAFGISGAIE